MFKKLQIKKQIRKLDSAVENGDTQAMYDLAMIYIDGSAVKKDTEKAYGLL